MIASSTGTSTTWFRASLDGSATAAFGGRCFFVIDVRATLDGRRTFDFAFFDVIRLGAVLRACLVLALRRFAPFLCVAIVALPI